LGGAGCFDAPSRAIWCVRRYPIIELARKHMKRRRGSCLWGFSVFSGFCWLCIFCVPLCVLLVCVCFLGERFYEGLISILDSGVFGPVV
jgi:hypothetical protein